MDDLRPLAHDEPRRAEIRGGDREYHDWFPDPPLLYRIIKRAIDIAASVLALVLLSPLFAIAALAIKLTGKGPVLFKHQRIGYHGLPFTMLKFRTMSMENDPQIHRDYVGRLVSGELGPVGENTAFKLFNDPRITPFGRFLRLTSLDELPQFWNVLRGDMTLVGPRPALPYEWGRYQPWHRRRLSSRPGITGLWQIEGRSTTTFDAMVQLDIEYIKRRSTLLDLMIIFMTPRAALRTDKPF
jgi:lipopolysaccharide/colanic/teichoic acid biosynthesis glycosyltransferase